MDKVKFLKQTRLFCKLDEEELQFLIGRLKVARYEAGEFIFVEGDRADAAYIVIDGEIELQKRISNEVDKTMFVAGPGDVFGEMGMLEAAPRSASAMARDTVALVWIGDALFQEIMSDRPSIGTKVLLQIAQMLSGRLRQTTNLYMDAVKWSIEVSGATKLHFHDLIEGKRIVGVGLLSGKHIPGRIIRTDDRNTHDITLKTEDGAIVVLPYHAIEYVRLDSGAEPIPELQGAAEGPEKAPRKKATAKKATAKKATKKKATKKKATKKKATR